MKKFLPVFSKILKGFTLIELLVVISIIAVLSLIAFAVYSGVTARGNDARRTSDMQAFADAMEIKKGNSITYVTVAATDFATGNFPKEPTSRVPIYCYLDGTSAIANPTTASWGGSSPTACPTGWTSVNGAAPTVSATATYFKFCTMNEVGSTNTTATGAAVICQGSRQ